ncbi:MAG: hypothetical protein M1834_008435 [Cirrosporium novae-zelandiae]|nr:MAG: hypothetical protein M1834_008435 [Cirrosporium novae-zelandiae]
MAPSGLRQFGSGIARKSKKFFHKSKESPSRNASQTRTIAERVSTEEVVTSPAPVSHLQDQTSLPQQDRYPVSTIAQDLGSSHGPEGEVPAQLWEKALQTLDSKKDTKELLHQYKKIVDSEMQEGGLFGVGSSESSSLNVTTLERVETWRGNQEIRQQLKDKSQIGNSKGEYVTDNIIKAVSSVAKTLSPLGAVNPYLGLACAGICVLAMPLLNAMEQHKTLARGLDQVSLATIQFNLVQDQLQRSPSDPPEASQIQSELKSKIVKLFSKIIEFQAKAVCYFCSSYRRIRDFVKADDWEELLEEINETKKACSALVDQIRQGREDARRKRQELSEKSQLLKLLPRAPAAFNDGVFQHQPRCHPNTRVDLIQHIEDWCNDANQESFIFWLKGLAGTGKSTVARTISARLFDRQLLGASFFFARGQDDLSNAKKFFTTLAFQLSKLSNSLNDAISEVIRLNEDVINKQYKEQWRHLICAPFEKCLPPQPVVIVIDALDECDNKLDIEVLLRIISKANKMKENPLRFFITSRPETSVNYRVDKKHDIYFYTLALHEVEEPLITHDITVYLKSELERIYAKYSDGYDCPDPDHIHHLAKRAGKFFIYAATVCRFIEQGGPPMYQRRLSRLLKNDAGGSEKIDDMYTQILESVTFDFSDEEKQQYFQKFRCIVGTIILLSDPLSVVGLSRLLNMDENDVKAELSGLGSILNIPKSEEAPIHLFHLSFHDFLLGEKRCKNPNLFIPEAKTHKDLVGCCLDLMSKTLTQNICYLSGPGVLVSEIEESKVLEYLPAHVQYACEYWAAHLERLQNHQENVSKPDDNGPVHKLLEDNGQVHKFLKEHFLHWIEALSLMGKVSNVILILNQLEHLSLWCYPCDASNSMQSRSAGLYALINDAKRFILRHRSLAELAPLQIYSSAIQFSPHKSIVRALYPQKNDEVSVVSGVEQQWNSILQTLEGHSRTIRTIAFSPDGSRLVSGSWDCAVRVWDVSTGRLDYILDGHLDWVSTVAFSINGKLASGSRDNTVRIWDIATGQIDHILEGHSDEIQVVTFSGIKLASGSKDGTVRIWDTITGRADHIFKDFTSHGTVNISPDGSKLVYGNDSDQIKLWNVTTGQVARTFEDVSENIAFSFDGSKLASGSEDHTLRIWDIATGHLDHILVGHSECIIIPIFSPDGKTLISHSEDNTIRIWDIATEQANHIFKIDVHFNQCITLSPNGMQLAFSSESTFMQIVDTTTGKITRTFKGHSDTIRTVAFSPDGTKLASGSLDNTIRIWDTTPDQIDNILETQSNGILTISFSPDKTKLVSGSSDTTIRIWDIETGQVDHIFQGHSEEVNSVEFSFNGDKLASGADDNTVRVWDIETEQTDCIFNGHSEGINSVEFSSNGDKLVSGAYDNTVRVWDIETEQTDCIFNGHSDLVTALTFSPNQNKVASGSRDNTVQIWDVITGQVDRVLNFDFGVVMKVEFSLDGNKVAAKFYDGSAKVWDVRTGQIDRTPGEGHPSWAENAFQSRGGLSLDESERWITRNGSRIFYLPLDHQPLFHCVLFEGNTVVTGSGSGCVTIMHFRPNEETRDLYYPREISPADRFTPVDDVPDQE